LVVDFAANIMSNSSKKIPIETLHLFPVLDKLLIELLTSLSKEDWHKQTIAKSWTVKDIASHLLDGNLRALSLSRDKYFDEAPTNINSYKNLVDYLNELNAAWVNATKRLSPTVLIELLETTGKQYHSHLQSLNPFETAIFSVAWAGEEKSENWFHIAREYTEKFIHQQQIREAVGKQALFTKELFTPFISTFMCALPYTYKQTNAPVGTTIKVNISTEIGGEWAIIKTQKHWQFIKEKISTYNSVVNIKPQTAWKLFSKGILPERAINEIEIHGNEQLGKIALQMISVMA
jgi:uncharacterized protein (TIGR03083 family)